VQAYDFTGAAVSALTFSFVSRSLSTGDGTEADKFRSTLVP
jgi:hypothetical protein